MFLLARRACCDLTSSLPVPQLSAPLLFTITGYLALESLDGITTATTPTAKATLCRLRNAD
jgi:hypothetical protein